MFILFLIIDLLYNIYNDNKKFQEILYFCSRTLQTVIDFLIDRENH